MKGKTVRSGGKKRLEVRTALYVKGREHENSTHHCSQRRLTQQPEVCIVFLPSQSPAMTAPPEGEPRWVWLKNAPKALLTGFLKGKKQELPTHLGNVSPLQKQYLYADHAICLPRSEKRFQPVSSMTDSTMTTAMAFIGYPVRWFWSLNREPVQVGMQSLVPAFQLFVQSRNSLLKKSGRFRKK